MNISVIKGGENIKTNNTMINYIILEKGFIILEIVLDSKVRASLSTQIKCPILFEPVLD